MQVQILPGLARRCGDRAAPVTPDRVLSVAELEARNRARVISRARTHGLLRPPVPACPGRGGHGPPGRTSTVSLAMSGPIAVPRGSLAS
ncbi:MULTISPECIES: hypothetical protein [Pseudonocardia]|uniref:hypothetical protein n=1 Tax=Pseudonocardia TaxID=1847 RepID=UPI000918C249|nr:hypothetical protein [Pseudonocardia sp. SID8383]MYW71895.1 hypothetical protein [Pseudonocardia sp. SID8383]OJG04372.1 hypothetical protein BG618_04255 [Pseudonocardia autotrophica]